MPKQDNNSKMAISGDAKEVAKKLIKLDPSEYVVGKTAREGLKKFSIEKHPILRHDAPNDEAKNNDRLFGGENDKDSTTRRADYDGDEDKKAYETTRVRNKLIEKFVRNEKRQQPENAQKAGSTTEDPEKHFAQKIAAEHETTDTRGSPTTEPMPKIKTKLPPQTVGEGYLTELGDQMSPAPATSDSPGSNADSSPVNNADQDSDKYDDQDKNSTENSDSTDKAKEALESIAMCSAKLYEDMPTDIDLPSWVLEKLELAKGFLDSIEAEFGGESEEQEEGENEGEPSPKEKPTADKGGQVAMAKESVLFEKNWIAGAIKHPGAEKAAAKKSGMSTKEYAEKHKDDKGRSGKRANLALTLMRMHKEEIESFHDKNEQGDN